MPRCYNGCKQHSGYSPSKVGFDLRVDNKTQHTSREFRSSMATLGIALEYIYVSISEQNGRIESLHKTLKSASDRGNLQISTKPKRHWI